MFRDKIELKDFEKMDAEYKDLLGRVLAIQADCEIGGPHLYVKDMLPTAPTKMDQLILARTAAEEVDHFRKVARVAGDIGVDVSYVLSWPNEKRYLEAFRGIINTMNMQCYSCHAVQIPGEKLPARAGGIGPDLTAYSALPKEYLAESIIKAHTVVAAPGYVVKEGKASMGNYNHFMTIQEMIDIVAFLKEGLGKR